MWANWRTPRISGDNYAITQQYQRTAENLAKMKGGVN
jgi:hypothetical protein